MNTNATPRCLACGANNAEAWATATDAEYKSTTDRFTLYHCRSCGVLFIDPVPRDRLQEIYPSNYYSFVEESHSFASRIKTALDRKLFAKILSGIPGQQLNVLDVGGGSGWELNVVRKSDSRVVFTQVVDFDPAAADLARKNGHEYFCGRFEEFRTEKTFDFILMLNLIEHVENPFEILSKARAMLSPHGRLLIKTLNFDALDAKIFRHKNWGGYHCPRHWVIFTKESFVEIAKKAGLSVAQFTYTQGAPFWASSVLFMLDRLGLVSITKERPVMFHPLFSLFGAAFAAFDFLRKPFAKTSQMFVVLKRE